MDTRLKGIHHITLCPGGAQEDVDFFTRVLGQRLVKQTVLMDGSIPVYHFYYGNADADPGSILTCFPYSRRAGPPRHRADRRHQLFGSGRVDAVLGGPLRPLPRLPHRHPGALRRPLDPGHPSGRARARGRGEPRRHPPAAGRRPRSRPTWPSAAFSAPPCRCATSRSRRRSSSTRSDSARSASRAPITGSRFPNGGPDRTIELLHEPNRPQGSWTFGAGTAHHIAFHVDTDEALIEQKALYEELGYTDTSEVKDRFYFHSMYVRSPGGVLVECTANVPGGFYVDETPEELGTHLNLPPWYEDQRDDHPEPARAGRRAGGQPSEGRGRRVRRRPGRWRRRRAASRCRAPRRNSQSATDQRAGVKPVRQILRAVRVLDTASGGDVYHLRRQNHISPCAVSGELFAVAIPGEAR